MSLKIVCISDTHEQESGISLPEGDLLIHAGDWTYKGSVFAIERFLDWFSQQPHKYKVFIGGNHEVGLDYGPTRKQKLKLVQSYCHNNIHYLEDDNVVIEGHKIHGSPINPRFYNWAWNRDRGPDIKKHWDMIPDDTSILITHGPPHAILDEAPRGFGSFENTGCQDLWDRIQQLKQLKLHVFGHIHYAYGLKEVNNMTFVNASICTENYKPTNLPIVVEI